MSSHRKLVANEHAAYEKSVAATAAVITARLDGEPEAVVAGLVRRSQAYRRQWLALSRTLELTEERDGAVTR